MKARTWKAYLLIAPYRGKISPADAAFFEARGIGKDRLRGALSVLRLVRRVVLPLRFGPVKLLFYVHDRTDGVPAPRGDHRTYLDLTLEHRDPAPRPTISRARFVRPARSDVLNVAGFDRDMLAWGGPMRLRHLLYEQTACLLHFIGSYRNDVSDVDLLKQVGQYLHLFANMSQLVVA